jgi:NitT/TauT family transport system substrate-binding protein
MTIEDVTLPLFRKRIVLFPVVIGGVLVVAFALFFHLHSRKTFVGKPVPLTIGMPALETNTLIYIAGDMGYFERNGLKVTIKKYDAGGAAVPALIRKEVDLALASEFVAVYHLLQQQGIRVLGSIDRFEDMVVIARKGQGIAKITDLNNRTIGVPLGTIAEFYLSRYLILHGSNLADAIIYDVRPDHSADALAAGKIDAVVTWHPYLDRIMDRYGEDVTVWPIQGNQLTYWNIIGRADWTGASRQTIERFLRAIWQAEEYAFRHPEETKAVVKKRLGYSDAYLAKVWGDNQFSLSLDESLISAMEDEARWVISKDPAGEKAIPDFVNYVYTDGLSALRPESVNIIR